jgi:hypothetical protein
MDKIYKIEWMGLKEYINTFSYKDEIEKINNKLINNSNIPKRLEPPHNHLCNNVTDSFGKNCNKMAVFFVNNKYECFWHYYMNDEND